MLQRGVVSGGRGWDGDASPEAFVRMTVESLSYSRMADTILRCCGKLQHFIRDGGQSWRKTAHAAYCGYQIKMSVMRNKS